MIDLEYLVTGTGRCGTVNLAMTLTSVGVPCSHERFFNGNSLEEAVAMLRAHGGRNSPYRSFSDTDPVGDPRLRGGL